MNIENDMWLRKYQEIIVSTHIMMMIAEHRMKFAGTCTASAKILFLQRMSLNHGAHGAIDDQDAFFKS